MDTWNCRVLTCHQYLAVQTSSLQGIDGALSHAVVGYIGNLDIVLLIGEHCGHLSLSRVRLPIRSEGLEDILDITVSKQGIKGRMSTHTKEEGVGVCLRSANHRNVHN